MPKLNGKVRLCLDPAGLNQVIIKLVHRGPTLNDIFQKLNCVQYLSLIDASSGYQNLKLDERSSYLRTFGYQFGRHRYKRLPFRAAPTADNCFQKGDWCTYIGVFCGKLDVRVNVIFFSNLSLCTIFWMIKVSSTYLLHSLGQLVTVLMVLVSNSSMNRLATIGLMCHPMAAPYTYSLTLEWKIGVFKTKLQQGDNAVTWMLFVELWVLLQNVLMIVMAGFTGTDVTGPLHHRMWCISIPQVWCFWPVPGSLVYF